MLEMKLILNEKLVDAERSLKKATRDNIIEVCEQYLRLLAEYREELYKLRGTPEINLYQSSFSRELIDQTRRSIRAAVESTTRARNETETLLKSFTCISGYDAVKTFNQLEYKGFSDWELRANEVRLKNDDNNERMNISEAVEAASLLRRQAYIAYHTTVWH